MKVYFDQDVWHYVVNEFSVSEFKQRVSSKQLEIYLGMDNVYEFAKCFLDKDNTKNVERGKEFFQYLSDLDITCFLKPSGQLIHSDLTYARTGGKLLPLLEKYNVAATKEEMLRLARGYCRKATDFIQKRERELEESMSQYRKTLAELNRKFSKPKDFSQLQSDWRYRRSVLDQSQFGPASAGISNSVLFSNPGKYPYLNTFVNTVLYFNFVGLKNPGAPSRKSTGDYRHLICANAVDYFVIEDRRIQRNSHKLCLYIDIYDWNDLKSIIS